MTAEGERDNVVHPDFEAHRLQIAIERSPFGPIRKYGEAILKNIDNSGESSQATVPVDKHQYRRFDQSLISAAIERTDTSDPNQPFIDF